ncbi:MAG: agmatine deiminase family protein [Kofleriaceae bacterium]|jgi:agmatine deiminase|nr:agmatine deiminase family protein [Kofleriaceae bacterium]MBP6841017.1 agmatine deiminase family protein [Kofleriaceae bacterium]
MARLHMPAEWAPHAAVWTAWPHDPEQWAEGLDAPRRSLMAMCAAIVDLDGAGQARGERVELLVRGDADAAAARALLGPAAAAVRFHPARYGDIWLRDTGPLFLVGAGAPLAACFRFDGWGGKYVMDGDTEVGATIAAATTSRTIRHDFVLEGGAVEVDGAGTILTTRQCLLGGARNPGLDQDALDALLRHALGGDQVVWLDRGLRNDHTDGHIDTIARFVGPGVVACMAPAADDPNRDALAAILADLRAARDASGRPLEVVTTPSPGAVLDAAGALMPASYMNFYIANTTVVVPTYDAPTDDAAVAAIASWFPGRRTVGVPGKAVVVGGGGFHCSTQQQPR